MFKNTIHYISSKKKRFIYFVAPGIQYNTTLTLFWELSTQYLFGFENLSFPAFITEIASQSWKFTQDECQSTSSQSIWNEVTTYSVCIKLIFHAYRKNKNNKVHPFHFSSYSWVFSLSEQKQKPLKPALFVLLGLQL